MTWTSRTVSAQWAVRDGHTSEVDAAGAIYVIGGLGSTTYYKDVWVSTNGGARPDSVGGVYTREVPRGTKGVLRGYYRDTKGMRVRVCVQGLHAFWVVPSLKLLP